MDALPWLSRARATGLGVAALVALGLALVAPEIYTGTFSDLGTFLRVTGVAVLLVVWSVLVRRFVPDQRIATVIAAVPAVIAIGVFVWPYLRPATEVDEAFPPVARVAADATTPPSTTGAAPTTTPVTTVDSTTAAPDPETNDPATTSPPATARPTTVPATVLATVAPTTVPSTTAPPTTVPAGPVELRRSGFQGLTGHRGSGDAVLYDLGGTQLLRFEEVDIGSGPDLNVYVVPGGDRRNLDGAIAVADLTAERGNQNYDLPAGVDLRSGEWTVLVWCETFAVEVANATF